MKKTRWAKFGIVLTVLTVFFGIKPVFADEANWQNYKNESWGVEFSYPAGFSVTTDKIVKESDDEDMNDWYRIKMENAEAPGVPTITFDINPQDTEDPFFPDEIYCLEVNDDGKVKIDMKEDGFSNEDHKFLMTGAINENNGDFSIIKMKYKDSDFDWQPTFETMIEGIKFSDHE